MNPASSLRAARRRTPATERPVRAPRADGHPLPAALRRALEQLSGVDLRDVRVHPRSPLPARLGARAFAFGSAIHLGPGADDALAHEAWHVVQQKQGRVAATARVNGLPLNDDPALEAEAERMARAARALAAAHPEACAGLVRRAVRAPVVQRIVTVQQREFSHRDLARFRDEIGKRMKLSFWNIFQFNEITVDLEREGLTFDSWDDLEREIRIRDVGYHAVACLEDLTREHRRRYEDATQRFDAYKSRAFAHWERDRARPADQRERFADADEYGEACRQEYQRLFSGIISWCNPSYPDAVNDVILQREMLRWLTGGLHEEPTKMNCWEYVLYGLVSTGRVTPDYIAWINSCTNKERNLMVHTAPIGDYFFASKRAMDAEWNRASASGGAVTDGTTRAVSIPRKVTFVDYAPYVPSPDDWERDDLFYIPTTRTIPRGRLLIFGDGDHVAISTGRLRQATNIVYPGGMGHEIIELDGDPVNAPHFSCLEDLPINKYLALPLLVAPFPICHQAGSALVEASRKVSEHEANEILQPRINTLNNQMEQELTAAQNASTTKLNRLRSVASTSPLQITRVENESQKKLKDIRGKYNGQIKTLRSNVTTRQKVDVELAYRWGPNDPYKGRVTFP